MANDELGIQGKEASEFVSAEIVLYETEGLNVPVEVRYLNETFWLTQKEIAELFGVAPQTVSRHLKNIFAEGELDKASTSTFFVQVRKEGSRDVARSLEIYNLDVIIAVGYRVNSFKATRFRRDRYSNPIKCPRAKEFPSPCFHYPFRGPLERVKAPVLFASAR